LTLPPFELHRPATLDEASALVREHDDAAALMCGGTELLLLMKLGWAEPAHVVDVKRVEELRGLGAEDGVLRIGAATTHRELERSTLVRERWPALAAMIRDVANIRVRSAGTIGGNLCFSDPHSDPATFLLAADAEVVVRGGGSEERRLPVADFVVGPYETALAPGELLVSVLVPELPAGSVLVHRKLRFHERPAATVAVLARVEDGQVAEARVAVGSVGPRPARAAEAERLLVEGAVDDAYEAAAEAAAPTADANGSVEYKRNLVRVLVRRAFEDAVARAA
jgi:carbon-monoxide dehydrogenase medium subunit